MGRFSIAAEVLRDAEERRRRKNKKFVTRPLKDWHEANLEELENKLKQDNTKVHYVGDAKITFIDNHPPKEKVQCPEDYEYNSDLDIYIPKQGIVPKIVVDDYDIWHLPKMVQNFDWRDDNDNETAIDEEPKRIHGPFTFSIWAAAKIKNRSKTPLMDLRTWHTTIYLDFSRKDWRKKHKI